MIVKYPDPVLRKRTKTFSTYTPEIKKTIELLEKELRKSGTGVGLAAPQIGKSKRIFALKDHHQIKTVCNPEIISNFEREKAFPRIEQEDQSQEDFLEGCLSFPGIYGTVKRWLRIRVKYETLNSKDKLVKKEEELEGFLAIVFQHELDHLNGVLFVDHIKEDQGKLYKEIDNKLKKIKVSEVL